MGTCLFSNEPKKRLQSQIYYIMVHLFTQQHHLNLIHLAPFLAVTLSSMFKYTSFSAEVNAQLSFNDLHRTPVGQIVFR